MTNLTRRSLRRRFLSVKVEFHDEMLLYDSVLLVGGALLVTRSL